MARWTDLAKWVGPSPNVGGRMRRHDGVVIHIAEGTYQGTIAWQRNPAADVSSHFIVSKKGEIAQMVDTDITAWTQRDGNGEWLSIENEGFVPSPLTAAQVEANARILARAHRVYGVPLQVTTTPRTRGLGHHSMGAENGINWGHPACPGPAIKAQKPAIVARAKQLLAGTPATPTPAPNSEVDMIRIKARDASTRYLSNGARIPSMDADAALKALGVPLLEVATTAEALALLPPLGPAGSAPTHEQLVAALREVLRKGVDTTPAG